MKLSTRQRLMASTLLIGAATLATPAWAQSTDQTAEPPVTSEADPDATQSDPGAAPDAETEGAIVVTGSRIPRPDLNSTSPLAVVQDEEFALSGAVNVEQVVNTLPQVVPGQTAFSNNPGGGVATLNLRGLGTQRNLVLVNGRRYIFFDTQQVVDLNTIPSFLLDSVDVVTGGASAVYGSDALAGVTNFHLRNDLNGILAGGQYSITQRGDGPRFNVYTALGTEFGDGRGNVTVYGEYYQRGDIFQDGRPFSAFTFLDGANGLVPGGSSGVPQGRFVAASSIGLDTDNNPATPPQVFPIASGTNYTGGGAFFATPGNSVPFTGSASPQGYNYAPSNYLMVPQKRWTLGGYGEYELIEGVNAYAEVAFINNRVDAELAATPITQNVDVNLANLCGPGATQPVSPADCTQLTTIANNQQAAIAAAAAAGLSNPFGPIVTPAATFPALAPGFVRVQANTRFTQIANRRNHDDRNAYRMVAGVRGEVVQDINYDLYYLYSRTKNAQVQEGNVSRSGFVRLVRDGTCNPFGLNQFSDECIEGVGILAQNQEESNLQVAQGSISGSLFKTPWANDAMGFAVGAEWRSMGAEFIPDTALSSGDVAGFNAGDPTSGNYDVKEIFGEVRLPLIQENFIHLLELTAAARYSDYSLDAVGGVPTYAIGAQLAPIRDVTFRAQYQRAVRAPNVGELFGGQAVGFPGATDPCSLPSAATDATVRALCIATGVPAANVGQAFLQPNAQIEGVFGGNPNLQEEVGDTYTAGVVVRPSFIPRLNIALDWYDIRVMNTIAAAGGGVNSILDLCYNEIQSASSPLCQAIHRDDQGSISGGGIFVVEANNANLARLDTEGVDLAVDYNLPINFGLMSPTSRLSFFFLGNYTIENSFTPVVGVDSKVECAGKFGLTCGEPTPKYKWSSRLSWMDGPLTSTVRWRHVGKVDDDDDTTDFIVEELDDYDLFDVALSFNVTDNATLNIGINNLFDKKPPLMGSNAEQANTYPDTYDVLGRDFFISANFRL